jgi:catechol 2,3-dioxygenase-like lactoylglutathione lyase family enzyme
MRIDHVVYGAGDLDRAAALVRDSLGLTVVGGGRHAGLGTHNRIVPLGDGYLELLAVADPQEAAGNPFGAQLQRRLAEAGDGLLGWAVEVDDVGSIADRLVLPIMVIEREGLTARITGVAEAMASGTLPFFLSRDHGIPDPGVGADAGGITWLELGGDAAELSAWLGAGHGLPLRVAGGPPGLRAVGIGDREFRP